MPSPTHIRFLHPDDRDAWQTLWNNYLDFYRNPLPDHVTASTFKRLCEQTHGLYGLVATPDDETPIGLAHFVIHPATWTEHCFCYFEDLYVDPTWRGTGVATQLIEAVYQHADQFDAARVYWHTQEYNAPARSLYDRLARRTSMIMYQR